jgi:Mg2+-importing ATPase
MFVVRTRSPFYKSRPGNALLLLTIAFGLITLAKPFFPFSSFLGFTPLPAWVMAALVVLTGLYVVAAEIVKKFFYARITL